MLFNALAFPNRGSPSEKGDYNDKKHERESMTEEEKALLSCMDENPVTVDQLGRRTNTSVDLVAASLLHLEIKGWVEASE